MNIPQDLESADILLYDTPDNMTDDIIELGTASDVAHIEIYHGNGLSLASRNGIGVNAYDFRLEGLMYVRRLVVPFDQKKADAWFYAGIRGLPYGWAGLLQFVNMEIPCKGLICSSFVDLYLQKGDAPMFADDFPPGKASPRDFKLTRQAATIWRRPSC